MTLDPLKKLRVVIAAGVVICLSIVGILWKPDKVIELKTVVFGVIETIQIDARQRNFESTLIHKNSIGMHSIPFLTSSSVHIEARYWIRSGLILRKSAQN